MSAETHTANGQRSLSIPLPKELIEHAKATANRLGIKRNAAIVLGLRKGLPAIEREMTQGQQA